MGYRYLPRYDPALRVTSQSAKQDRIAVVLGDWFLGPAADRGAYWRFFAALYPVQANRLAPQPIAPSADPWFVHRDAVDPGCPTLTIRGGGRGRGLRSGTPLVAGELRTRRYGRSHEVGMGNSEPLRLITLSLSINPTRYLHHQPKREWIPSRARPVSEWALATPLLTSRDALLSSLDEHSLDGRDNLIMGRAASAMSISDAWPIHIERYWSALVGKFNTLFSDAANAADLQLQWTPALNLRTIETYWEFSIDDPLSWLLEIEPVLASLGHTAEARNFSYEDGLSATGREGNSRSLTVRIRSGVKLRVYAKTSRRIRFEIEHDLMEHARPLGGRHTSDDAFAFAAWCNEIAADAATQANQVLEFLARARPRGGDEASVTQLVIAVTQALRDDRKAMEVLTLLAANQAIEITGGAELRAAVRSLKDAQILEAAWRGASRSCLTPRYRTAGLQLRHQWSATSGFTARPVPRSPI